MAREADGSIRFDLSIDLGKIKTAISDASDKINSKFTQSFSDMGKRCQESCDKAAREFSKVNDSADETRKKIDAILNDQSKGMKSKVSSIASIYREQGMDQSESMKKAWSEIERTSRSSSRKINKDIKGIGDQAQKTSGDIQRNFVGVLKKAGAALAAAFTVKKIIDFGAACIELGSDLEEVQNVVDVTFPQMSRQVDEFAKNAAQSFGLSETMAKRFTGTFGAMAKAFGFNEQAAYEMSTTLTGLAGDVASFYNITQDEAYTKLKSVFTGETESLKDLGVVMTQNALDAYAMANGFGKTTSAMSEMEKVALRYQFVQDQLSASAGDFVRTSDSWANQVRILKLQFDSLKATIGQGLINVLTPVIKVINTIIGKLMSLANAFRSFTELITGKKNGGVSAAAAGMDAVASAADQAGSATSAAGNAAKKAAKDIKGITTGIDELNIIDQGTDDTGSGSAGAGAAGGTFSLGQADTSALDEADSKYQKLIDRLKELAALAQSGFWDAFGDVSVFDSIQGSIDSIRQSLAEIFTAPEVMSAADGFAESVAYNLGRIAGAVASVGATVADNLLGGISKYLEQNSPRIQKYLVSMFDLGSKIAKIKGDLAKALADIFTVFRSDSAKQITADIISVFADGFMGATRLGASFGTDVLEMLTAPIVNNVGAFKGAFQGLLDVVQENADTIAGLVSGFVDGILQLYDQHIHPLFESLKTGFTEIVATILNAFQANILPVLQNAANEFSNFSETVLQPLIEKFLEFGGGVADAINTLWTTVLQPFVVWFIEQAAPIIASVLQGAIGIFNSLATTISEVITSILTVLNGLLKFLTGIFTGNWKLAWEGVQEIFRGVWEMMKAIVNAATNIINSVITAAWNLAKAKTTAIWNSIKTILSGIWNALKALAAAVFEAIKTIIYTAWEAVSAKTSEIWEAIKNALQSLWNTVKNTAAAVFEAIKTIIYTAWEAVKAKTSEIWEAIKNALQSLWNTVKNTASNTFTAIKDAIVNAWTEVKNQTKQIWDGIWGIIKGVINSIIGGVESMANRVIDGINSIIEGINDLVGPLADFVNLPTIPKLRRVKLPRLAQGGFVRANTPQLAMIGDNRHYGEIVAPEDKMQEMVNRAAALAAGSGGMSDQHLVAMIELLQRIIELIENLDLTVSIDIREIRKKLIDLEKRSGYTLRTT